MYKIRVHLRVEASNAVIARRKAKKRLLDDGMEDREGIEWQRDNVVNVYEMLKDFRDDEG